MVKVSLARNDKSYEAVRRALELVRDDIHVPDGKPVLIKTNMVSPTTELAATPVEAVRATMDFLMELGVESFIIGEGSARTGDTMGAFERFGYLSLKEHYNVAFRDLNQDDFVLFEALDGDLNPVTIRLAKSYFNAYVVSVTRMKTHARVVLTLSVKNIAISSILNPDRHSPFSHEPRPGAFSHEPRSINLSIARLAQTLPIHLAVIDGVVGMEGNGPVDGTPVSSGVALASTDALAADLLGSEIMGFDSRTVGYLWYLSRLRGLSRQDIQVVGESPIESISRYKEHETMCRQLAWWVNEWEEYLQGSYLKSPTAS